MAKGQKTKELEGDPPIGFAGSNSAALVPHLYDPAVRLRFPPQNLLAPGSHSSATFLPV